MRGTDNIPSIRERFDDYLQRNKRRRTAERFAILEMVQTISGHFNAEELAELMRKDDFPVSGATVYATLELLVDFGLLVRQRFSDKACSYEKASASAAHIHHHLICTVCGKIKEVRDPLFSKQIEERRFPGFSQSYYSLNIYGICGSCSRKKHRTKVKKD